MHRPAICAALGLLLLAGCDGSSRTSIDGPDHVVLILIDTLRADHLGGWGYEPGSTPALDRLASEGVRFERAISQSSWTAPSVLSLFTGRYLADDRLDLPGELTTLAECFQRAGWATRAFIYNDIINEENGFRRGFDEFTQHVPYTADEPVAQWLASRAGEKTFTYVHLNEPHDPYLPEDPSFHRRLKEPGEVDPERMAYYRSVSEELGLSDHDASVRHIAKEIAGYDDDVSFTDWRVGNLLEALERSGQSGSSAELVTADHGEGLRTRVAYHTGKRKEAEDAGEDPTLVNTLMPTHGNQVSHELVHVPLILRAPGLPAGRAIAELVENVDIAPTLLHLADVAPPENLPGRSLLDLLEDPEAWTEAKPYAFSTTRFASRVETQDGWQLILPTELGMCAEELTTELYDLKADPRARRNIASEHPERVEHMSRLAEERRAIGIRRGATSMNAGDLSADALKVLDALGYTGSIVDEVREEFARATFAELLALFAESDPCVVRLEIARALKGRELAAEEEAAIRELMAGERWPAVQKALSEALGEG